MAKNTASAEFVSSARTNMLSKRRKLAPSPGSNTPVLEKMDLPSVAPANFFVMRMGAQWRRLDKKALKVVPSAQSGTRPARKAWIRTSEKSCSSGVHLPLLKGRSARLATVRNEGSAPYSSRSRLRLRLGDAEPGSASSSSVSSRASSGGGVRGAPGAYISLNSLFFV